MIELLSDEELPADFSYPAGFLHLVTRGLLYFEPWFVLGGDQLRERYRGIQNRYPGTTLIPFARREDSDDVACFDSRRSGAIAVIHDFADPGWERRRDLGSIADWVRMAVEDMLAYDSTEE